MHQALGFRVLQQTAHTLAQAISNADLFMFI